LILKLVLGILKIMKNKGYSTVNLILLIISGLSILGISFYFVYQQFSNQPPLITNNPPTPPTEMPQKSNFKKFESEEEFKTYIESSSFADFGAPEPRSLLESEAIEDRSTDLLLPTSGGGPSRVSETNVQVKGVDEPDIVKTDGNKIYYSLSPKYGILETSRPTTEESVLPPRERAKTNIINAFPPGDLKIDEAIDKQGDLLLIKNNLIVFENNSIYAYDISDTESPRQLWDIDLNNNTRIVEARLFNNQIYLITQQRINQSRPCPIRPMTIGENEVTINCTDIYRPETAVPVDVTFTAFQVNPQSGGIINKVSFVGSSGRSVLYMSENGLYSTFSYYENPVNFFYKFLNQEAKDLVNRDTLERLEKLSNYNISNSSKLIEMQVILEQWKNSLSEDERLQMENEISNRMDNYFQEHKRELETTGIAKIGLNNFQIRAAGAVPGTPLNQFSLDEYQGNLRIATTVGQSRLFGTTSESANDVYILDKNLEQLGSVKNMGLDERIYSVRFIGDKGYVVTFKQIDPFYVLDLSNPGLPQIKGELKIPGYSSYLHPLDQNRILGIGKEDNQVKISVFNVLNPENPVEENKYLLDEYWSDILDTHHAFLLDKKHEIFFLPGNKGGYIFSYKENQLKLAKAVSDISPKRALYLDDYLYILGDQKLVVLNEIDWNRVNDLEL
jgi:inhibitor of cysteine peptidase